MFRKIRRMVKAIATVISIVVAVLPTLLSPEMRSLYASLAS